MEPNVFDKVHEVDLKKTMEQSYIDYAMSVISARPCLMSGTALSRTEACALFHDRAEQRSG